MLSQINIRRIWTSHFHPLCADIAITQDNSHATRMFIIANPCPANGVGMVKVIVLLPISIFVASVKKFID